jgi:hypothetical protein
MLENPSEDKETMGRIQWTYERKIASTMANV